MRQLNEELLEIRTFKCLKYWYKTKGIIISHFGVGIGRHGTHGH